MNRGLRVLSGNAPLVAFVSVLLFVGTTSAQTSGTSVPAQWCSNKCVAVGGPVSGKFTSLGTPQGWIVGEIRIFAFGDDSQQLITDLATNGWVECAGQSVKFSDYPELWSLVGRTWGSADKTNVFYLPDLRGVFVRGWNHGRVAPPKYGTSPYTGDEDLNSRVPPRPEAADAGGVGGPLDQNGNYVKNHVGMLEADQIRAHNHVYSYEHHTQDLQSAYDPGATRNAMAAAAAVNAGTSPAGGAETHPANAAVMFFMYLGHPSAIVAASSADVQKGKTASVRRIGH